jgi:hypothetical protein
MSFSIALRPKRVANLVVTLLICASSLVLYGVWGTLFALSPKRGLGLVFGILGALVFTFEMVYPLRRPRARPLGRAQAWLQLHIYAGAFAFLCVLIHCDFTWPHGAIGWGLLLLSAWTTLTGLLGVLLQKWVPSALSDGLRVEALYERIPALIEKLVAEADALVDKASSDVMRRFYKVEVRPKLGKVAPSWAYLVNVRSGRERALEPFRRVSQYLGEEERAIATDLEQIYDDKLQLDAHYSLQGILRRWVILHAPPAGLLMGLLAIHILSWVFY